jgi:hypothetical protein
MSKRGRYESTIYASLPPPPETMDESAYRGGRGPVYTVDRSSIDTDQSQHTWKQEVEFLNGQVSSLKQDLEAACTLARQWSERAKVYERKAESTTAELGGQVKALMSRLERRDALIESLDAEIARLTATNASGGGGGGARASGKPLVTLRASYTSSSSPAASYGNTTNHTSRPSYKAVCSDFFAGLPCSHGDEKYHKSHDPEDARAAGYVGCKTVGCSNMTHMKYKGRMCYSCYLRIFKKPTAEAAPRESPVTPPVPQASTNMSDASSSSYAHGSYYETSNALQSSLMPYGNPSTATAPQDPSFDVRKLLNVPENSVFSPLDASVPPTGTNPDEIEITHEDGQLSEDEQSETVSRAR